MKKVTEWRDRVTWPKETRRNAMASLNYLYLKVTRCSACKLLGSVQAQQGRKLMCKRARKRSNYKSHTPGLTIFRVSTRMTSSFTCNTNVGHGEKVLGGAWGGAWKGAWGRSLSKPICVPPLYNSETCNWPLGEEPNWSICDGRVDIESESLFPVLH